MYESVCVRVVNLQAEIEACVSMYTQEAEDTLLSGQPTFVLDAIDNIDTKVRRCTHRHTRIYTHTE